MLETSFLGARSLTSSLIVPQAGITFFGVQRFRLGAQGAFQSSDQIEEQVNQQQGPPGMAPPGMAPPPAGQQPYGAYPGTDSADMGGYKQAPFGTPGTGVDGMSGDLGMGSNQYQPPTY